MASLSLLLSAVLLVIASFFISPSSQVTNEIISTICSQVQNEEFCQKILENDARTSTADLPELSLISIELTIKQATENYKNFSVALNNATNPVLGKALSNCLKMYKSMGDMLNQAYQLSKLKEYKKISQVSDAKMLAYDCENGIPVDFSSTAAISEMMILTCQTASSVNVYISG